MQEPGSVSIYETCSLDLRKATDRATLEVHVTLEAAFKIILVILAVASVMFLAVTELNIACAIFLQSDMHILNTMVLW